MKRAMITGVRGQDGAYIAELLLRKGYKVYGADRRSGESSYWRFKELGIANDVEFIYMDLIELTNIMNVVEKIKPDEIYNLGAQSFVKTSFDQPILTSDINALGVLRLLEAIRLYNTDIRFYQASTSEMFGNGADAPQNENTPFCPASPYAVSKLFAHWMVVNYREAYNIYAVAGILFNHESPLRGLEFITRKITHGIAMIKHGKQDKIVVGNIDAKRDWGYAKEYVEAMWLMLNQKIPKDYVVATGISYTVRQLIEVAFKVVDIDIEWKNKGIEEKGIDKRSGKVLIEISKDYYRPVDVVNLRGDCSKIKADTGWQPKISFRELVEIMVEADVRRVAADTKWL